MTHTTFDPRRRDALACIAVGLAGGIVAPRAFAAATTSPASTAKAAPDFTLRRLNGANLRLAEQRGQVVMLNFWATWCAPCREEMPQLARLHEKYRASGFAVLAVNLDDAQPKAAAAATTMALPFPVLFDTDKTVAKAYDVSTMPSSFFVDRDGRMRHVHKGYRAGDEAAHEQVLRSLLKE
jgi:peroxiredoxin